MPSMQEQQQGAHDQGHDYAAGSPHIRHHGLRSRIVEQLQESVRRILDAKGSCRALEVGAGHGTFTDHIVAAGAEVEVTEMSVPSAEELRSRFRHNPAVTVVDDPDGSRALHGEEVDLVVCLSVLHHIPDYVVAVRGMLDRILPGGGFVSFQDPLWYPRRSRVSRQLERAAYLAWRLPRGDLGRGLATAVRRARGVYDETNPSDMVEYHAMRDGVDERALLELLEPRFAGVRLLTYWSSQGHLPHTLGALAHLPNTFGLVATDHHR
jgi:SAM-dependent methyltransferase